MCTIRRSNMNYYNEIKNNIEIINEKALHNLILENVESFMKELVIHLALQVVSIKLKKVEYISQVQKYMHYIDQNIKTIEENDTVGIIICKQDNKYVIKYCSDDRIIVRNMN